MDYNQRSRGQKSGAGHPARAPRRSVSSRMGLEKRGAPAQQPPRGNAPRPNQQRGPNQPPRSGQPPRQNRPGQNQPNNGRRPRPQQQINPQKSGYTPGSPRRQRRVTQAEILRRTRRRRFLGMLAVLAVLAIMLGAVWNGKKKKCAAAIQKALADCHAADLGAVDAHAEDYCARLAEADRLRAELERFEKTEADLNQQRQTHWTNLRTLVDTFAPEVKDVFGFSAAITRALTLLDSLGKRVDWLARTADRLGVTGLSALHCLTPSQPTAGAWRVRWQNSPPCRWSRLRPDSRRRSAA